MIKTKVVPEGKTINNDGKLVFAKGHKPHAKAGRPKGSLSRTKALAEGLMGTNAQNIVKKIIQKALTDGDKDQAFCLKLCLDRILPPQRSVDIRATQDTSIQIVVDGIKEFSKVIAKEEMAALEADYEEVEEEETNG